MLFSLNFSQGCSKPTLTNPECGLPVVRNVEMAKAIHGLEAVRLAYFCDFPC